MALNGVGDVEVVVGDQLSLAVSDSMVPSPDWIHMFELGCFGFDLGSGSAIGWLESVGGGETA